jgi:sugar-specific transcriptional regulator TrmB
MLNNKDSILLSLKRLGLTPDEAKVYLSLVESSMSHLEVARKTGVNRTKVYRIADELAKRGLITEETNDSGRVLAAGDPANLEITLTTAEEKLKTQRQVLTGALPTLQHLFQAADQPKATNFIVNTYEGEDGFKQMLWNELKTKGEILIFGHGMLQDLVSSPRWAEKHRAKTLESGYKVREILNPDGKPVDFTKNTEFVEKVYVKRIIPADVLPLGHQLCIYNNTVAIYNWANGQKVGTEIVNKAFATTQRAIFEHYWTLAK